MPRRVPGRPGRLVRGDTRESGRRAFPVPRPDSNQMQSKSVQSALCIILSYIPLKPLSNRPSPEENDLSRARTSAAERHGPRRLPPKHTGQHLIPLLFDTIRHIRAQPFSELADAVLTFFLRSL